MDFEVYVGDLISSPSSQYEVIDVLGCGSFGAVTQCRKIATNEMVALKMMKRRYHIEEAKEEAAILQMMKELGSDDFNIVRYNDAFTYEGQYYLEFEKLDISLHNFLRRRHNKLQLMEIRPILQQVATALMFLKSIGVVHTDLKPDNIMMVDHLRQPFKVKLIDFGLARNNPEEWTGISVQPQWFRSPEVFLGAPFNEAIDVWSLGCIAAQMLTGTILFPGKDKYDMMRHIYYTVGKPPDHILNAGLHTDKYFRPNYKVLEPPQWTFMSSLEMRHFVCNPRTINSLSDLMKKASGKPSGEDASADAYDWASFVDLLTQLLAVDAWKRITPSRILKHSFITMSHLVGMFDNSLHVKSCMELMSQALSCHVAQEETSNSTASPACHPDEGHPAVSVKKLLSNIEEARFSLTKIDEVKRKRADEEASGSEREKTSPDKRRRAILDGGDA